MNATNDPDDDDVNIDEPDDSCEHSSAQHSAALFILKAKEDRMLTQNALNGIIQDITGNCQSM